MAEPVADRPDMPEGYLADSLLPWEWAEEQLLDARNYWVTTIAASGKPHVRPVWGVWIDSSVQFSTGARHAEHIARDPRVTVNLESGDDCVIVEGVGEVTTNKARRQAFIDAYEPKYDWPISLDFVGTLYVVKPRVVLGWISLEVARGATLFGATATRWRFDEL